MNGFLQGLARDLLQRKGSGLEASFVSYFPSFLKLYFIFFFLCREAHAKACVESRGQFAEVAFLLLPCVSLELKHRPPGLVAGVFSPQVIS